MSLSGYDAWLTTNRAEEEYQAAYERWYDSDEAYEAYREAISDEPRLDGPTPSFLDWADTQSADEAFEAWHDKQMSDW